MIVLDTTVLVYAVGAEHPLRAPCRTLVDAISKSAIEASTTAQVIQEFVHVRSKRRERADAVGVGLNCSELLEPLVAVTSDHLRRGLRLFASVERLGAFDCVLATAARAAAVDALVSANRAFAEVDGLRHVVPDEAGVASLL